MDMSQAASVIMEDVVNYVGENEYEYVTPEIILYFIADYNIFCEAFINCGGNVKVLKDELYAYFKEYIEQISGVTPELSAGAIYALAYAEQTAENSGCKEIDITHILHGIWQLEDSHAVYFMKKQGITEADLLSEMAYIEDEVNDNLSESEDSYFNPYDNEDREDIFDDSDADEYSSVYKKHVKKNQSYKINEFAPCLNDNLDNVNPLIGREDELERTIQILCRKDKNNPLHIGEPGVGKTAITYGLAKRINEGNVPEPLLNSKIFSLDLGGMLAGTKYRGDFEKRLKKVLSEIEKQTNPIIYIDEIHNLTGAGATGDSSLDAGNLLKPYLASGKIRFIGATTFEEYKKYFEKNKSLVRRFQNVEIKEPSEEETVGILKGLKEGYEEFHGVTYDDEVLSYAVSMSAKHINERFLPDKAIDLIDEAGAYRKLHPVVDNESKTVLSDTDVSENDNNNYSDSVIKQKVDKDVINIVLTKICRVPLETVETEETAGLAHLEDNMKSKIFGQDEAIAQVVNAVKFSKAGLLDEGKPLASLLFVGPTGVGKTEVAKTLANELGVKLIRFDMSEYGEKHAVAKLIGAPAGYVGYEEGGLLTEEIRKNPFAVLLLDEIEKAHHDIYNVLLQTMDYATLTDNQGRKADFRNVVIIMTSNAGAARIGKKSIGFTGTTYDSNVIMDEVNNTFQPEFRNRLNRIVVFNGMDDDMAVKVVEKKLGELKELLLKKNISMNVDDNAFSLIKKKGVSEEFGAREIDRVIRNEIKPLLVDDMLFGKLKDGGKVTITSDGTVFQINAN